MPKTIHIEVTILTGEELAKLYEMPPDEIDEDDFHVLRVRVDGEIVPETEGHYLIRSVERPDVQGGQDLRLLSEDW